MTCIKRASTVRPLHAMAAKKAPKKTPDRKTEVLSIRIDPRVKYGLELLARLQRRSTTGVVEWAIQEAFGRELFDPGDNDGHPTKLDEELDRLWQINEIERLVALALRRPQLLTFEESRAWKVLKDTAAFWKHQRYPDFDAFHWKDVLPQWDKLAPLLNEAVERNIVRGLTPEELSAAGISLPGIAAAPQRPARRVAQGTTAPPPPFADDFDDSDIPF